MSEQRSHIDSFRVLLYPDEASVARLAPVTDRALRAARDLLAKHGANPAAVSKRPPGITAIPEGDVIRRWLEAKAPPDVAAIVEKMRRTDLRLRKTPIVTEINDAYVGNAGGKHITNRPPHPGGVLPYFINLSFGVRGTPELDALLQDIDNAVSEGGLPSSKIVRTGEQHLHGLEIDQTPDVLQLEQGHRIPKTGFGDIMKIAFSGMQDRTIALGRLVVIDATGRPMF